MTSINLTDDDIAANRRGQLSGRQHRVVHSMRLVWIAGTVGLATIALGLAAVLLFKLQHPSFASRGELIIVVPILLLWFWILRHMPQRWQLANLDLIVGQVAAVEGPVQADVDFGIGLFRPVRRYILVNDRSFRVSKAQQRSFRTGQIYRIYHSPHGHQFLGALLLADVVANKPGPFKLAEPLTSREQEVLKLVAAGLTSQQIGAQLSLSVNTVKMYTSQLYQKLGVNRRTAAVARARELDLL